MLSPTLKIYLLQNNNAYKFTQCKYETELKVLMWEDNSNGL